MRLPLISVIIPVYNRPDLVSEALDSVLAQDYSSFEIIVVDDGSTDRTPAVLEAFKAKARASRPEIPVILLGQEHSGMPGQARNRGVREARGAFLAFLDSDDLWVPEKLSRQAAFLQNHPEFEILHSREVWRRGDKTVSQKGQKHRREGDIFTDALVKCIIGPSTVIMSARLYRSTGGFHEQIEVAEDYEYWLRLTALYPVGYLDEPLTIKRAGSWDQLSEKYGQIEIFRIRALEGLLEEGGLPEGRRTEARAALAHKCRIYAEGCRKRDKLDEARTYEEKAALWRENADRN